MTMPAGTDAQEALLVASMCADTVVRFTAAFDEGDLARMQEHFAPDGVWQRHDGVWTGHPGLAALMEGRDEGIFVRHVLSNFRTTWLSATRASVDSYVTVYRHDFPADRRLPAPLRGPDTLARYRDELMFVNGSWQIALRQVHVDFKHP
jgi:hypothetical protein